MDRKVELIERGKVRESVEEIIGNQNGRETGNMKSFICQTTRLVRMVVESAYGLYQNPRQDVQPPTHQHCENYDTMARWSVKYLNIAAIGSTNRT